MFDMLTAEGCISDHQDQVDIEKLRYKIVDEGSIEIEIFNQLLKQSCEYKVESSNYHPDTDDDPNEKRN